jgi:dephospho-CoA kinase
MRANEFVKEGVNDPAIFKVVFVVGGPGSGKSYISERLGLSALGFVTVNSDVAFEYLMKKHDIDPKMPPEEKEKRDVVRSRAKEITATKSDLAIEGRLGIHIDGTGDDYDKIANLKKNFELLGYDCFLVIVNTKLEVARKRNQMRARTVPDKIVVDSWYNVQDNIGRFANIFTYMSIIDNSGDSETTEEQINKTYGKLQRFAQMTPNKPAAKKWIEDKKKVEEASYPGNIGAMEMFKFRQMASPKVWDLMKKLLANGKEEEAWRLLQKVTNTKLH